MQKKRKCMRTHEMPLRGWSKRAGPSEEFIKIGRGKDWDNCPLVSSGGYRTVEVRAVIHDGDCSIVLAGRAGLDTVREGRVHVHQKRVVR